jgi:hypothetical protein
MDHSVAGSFTARMSGVHSGMAAENIAAGTKTWAETFHMWQTSPGHNANLLQSKADIVGVAVAYNERTRYKTYWAMVIAEKPSKKKPGILSKRKDSAYRSGRCREWVKKKNPDASAATREAEEDWS